MSTVFYEKFERHAHGEGLKAQSTHYCPGCGHGLAHKYLAEAIEKLGSVESVELPEEGEEYEQGEVIVTVEGTHGRIELKAPATGMIHEINASTQDEPETVQEDPLEEGWLVKLEVDDPEELREFAASGKGATSSDEDSDEEEDDDLDEEDEDDSDDEEE